MLPYIGPGGAGDGASKHLSGFKGRPIPFALTSSGDM